MKERGERGRERKRKRERVSLSKRRGQVEGQKGFFERRTRLC